MTPLRIVLSMVTVVAFSALVFHLLFQADYHGYEIRQSISEIPEPVDDPDEFRKALDTRLDELEPYQVDETCTDWVALGAEKFLDEMEKIHYRLYPRMHFEYDIALEVLSSRCAARV